MIILIKGKKVVTKLQCKVCIKHKLIKYFSNKWIEEVDSIRTSDIRDHIRADQPIHVIEIEKNRAKANHIVLTVHFQFIPKNYLCTYICGWPNNFLNGQILAKVFGHICPSTYFFLFLTLL